MVDKAPSISQQPKHYTVTHLHQSQQQSDIFLLLNENLCELTPQIINLFCCVFFCNSKKQYITTQLEQLQQL